MSKMSSLVLKKQKKTFLALVGFVVMLAGGVGYLVLRDQSYAPSARPRPHIDLPADKMNPQDLWMERVESHNTLLDQKIKYLEDMVLQTKKQEVVIEQEKRGLKQEIAQLRQQLRDASENPVRATPTPFNDPFFEAPREISIPPIFAPLVEFCMDEPIETIGTVDRTVPAGTTVKALLVSSVDADCGVYSSTDPIPVKLRLLDDGHLPKGVDVHLKGAIIIGSAFGNISSERVHMRIERLTQVNPAGQFVETEVAGYVSGEDGKYGVRGTVVDKSAKIITNAAISGLFSEAGQILQSAVGNYRVENLNNNQAVSNPFVAGMGGTSNAFDMLADYYIKRADHVQPVIQVTAGRIVDVTFTHGAQLGDLHTQDQVKALRARSRSQP